MKPTWLDYQVLIAIFAFCVCLTFLYSLALFGPWFCR